MARTAKKQIEIPGAERASIPEVDSRVVAYVDATDELARIKEQVKETKADLAWALREYSDGMDKNSDGDPVYTFVDGDKASDSVCPRASRAGRHAASEGGGGAVILERFARAIRPQRRRSCSLVRTISPFMRLNATTITTHGLH